MKLLYVQVSQCSVLGTGKTMENQMIVSVGFSFKMFYKIVFYQKKIV